MIDLPIRTDGLVVLGLYMAGCLLTGAAGFVAKRSAHDTSVEDHFLAGSRGLPAPVLLGTVFAQTLSGWALLGYPGAAYREGLGAIKWLPASVCIGVGMAVVNPRLHRLGRPRRWLTPCDFVRARFGGAPGGAALHALTCATMLVPTLFYVLIQFKGLASAVHAVSGGAISGYAGAALAALVMLAYDLAGGMRSVAWTDCVQVGPWFLPPRPSLGWEVPPRPYKLHRFSPSGQEVQRGQVQRPSLQAGRLELVPSVSACLHTRCPPARARPMEKRTDVVAYHASGSARRPPLGI